MCYRFVDTKKIWENARRACQSLDAGDLVVISDEDEQQFLKTQIDPAMDYWIGLREGDTKHTYAWVDGSNLVYGNVLREDPWELGAPNNVRTRIYKLELSFWVLILTKNSFESKLYF